MVRPSVRAFRMFVRSCLIQFDLGSFTLTDHMNAIYNESVHRKEQRTSVLTMIP